MVKRAALEQFHKDRISAVADELFMRNGIEKTTMEEIAREAEYSKATLYAYFKSKEEMFHYITLKGMGTLHAHLERVLQKNTGAVEQYLSMCEILAAFYEEHPLCFQSMLETIASDVESREQSKVLEEIYQVGEALNDDLQSLIEKGVREEVFKEDLLCLPTGLIHWSALSGIVSLVGKKQEYIVERTGMKKEQLLKFGFQMMLNSIIKGGGSVD